MDVISLLNSDPAAAGQRKRACSGSSRAPSRNRTPWDAGGYALPINTAVHITKVSQQPGNRSDDLPTNTPPSSPKHSFSDSRSSLSSFASSLQSRTCHSRFSSTSTLNSSFHVHHKSSGTDIFSPELRSIPQTLEDSASCCLAENSYRANNSRHDTSLSPISSFQGQSTVVVESQLPEQRSEFSRRNHDEMETTTTNITAESGATSTLSRPGSPSDAILIKRTSNPVLRVNTGDLGRHPQQMRYFSVPLDRYRSSLLQSKTHKRTLSEPNYRPVSTLPLVYNFPLPQPNTFLTPAYGQHIYPSAEYYSIMDKSSDLPEGSADDTSSSPLKVNDNITSIADFKLSNSTLTSTTSDINISAPMSTTLNLQNLDIRPQAEPTPPSSSHSDHASPISLSPTYADPDTPPTLTTVADTQTIVCMYVPDCDTGSQLRKAISHIFGRNKMCTRLIPDEVWVHYCRKHYQRARYRNPKEYAKCQCDLVQEQLDRIHTWSENNRAGGSGSGVVQDWTLAIRKRELKRQEEKQRKSNKRKHGDIEADNNDEDHEDAGHEPATAVPQWLRERCVGQRYSTLQVRDIFNELHRDILAETGSASFPDLEILPNISTDINELKDTKRTSSSTSHRRSQSMGVVSSQNSTCGHEPSMLDALVRESSIHNPSTQKRRRPNSRGNEELVEPDYPSPRLSARPYPRRPEIRLPVRQMYPHPEERSSYGHSQHGGYYGCSTSSYHAPLPAPTPQRLMGYSTASYLEQGPELRRPMHARSQSDVGFMNGQPEHMRPLHGYYHEPRFSATYLYHQDSGKALHDQINSPPIPRTSSPDIRAPYPSHGFIPGHSRHQSTPMMQPSTAQAYNYQTPRATGGFTYAPPPLPRSPLPPTPRVIKNEKAQQLFHDRQ